MELLLDKLLRSFDKVSFLIKFIFNSPLLLSLEKSNIVSIFNFVVISFVLTFSKFFKLLKKII